VLPHGRDLLDNAVRVASRGAGIKLKRTATASQIARAVTTVLTDPVYRESAALLGAAIRRDASASDQGPCAGTVR
jgi:UDP:flavonoid glycosyltransferase YjiC (YdhE family)